MSENTEDLLEEASKELLAGVLLWKEVDPETLVFDEIDWLQKEILSNVTKAVCVSFT